MASALSFDRSGSPIGTFVIYNLMLVSLMVVVCIHALYGNYIVQTNTSLATNMQYRRKCIDSMIHMQKNMKSLRDIPL